MMPVVIHLPFPPSVNHYYRVWQSRILISEDGRKYRRSVNKACKGIGGWFGAARLQVEIVAHPPDKRRRDLDNLLKAFIDALKHANVFTDDCQIDKLDIVRGDVVAKGLMIVKLTRRLEAAG